MEREKLAWGMLDLRKRGSRKLYETKSMSPTCMPGNIRGPAEPGHTGKGAELGVGVKETIQL